MKRKVHVQCINKGDSEKVTIKVSNPTFTAHVIFMSLVFGNQ